MRTSRTRPAPGTSRHMLARAPPSSATPTSWHRARHDARDVQVRGDETCPAGWACCASKPCISCGGREVTIRPSAGSVPRIPGPRAEYISVAATLLPPHGAPTEHVLGPHIGTGRRRAHVVLRGDIGDGRLPTGAGPEWVGGPPRSADRRQERGSTTSASDAGSSPDTGVQRRQRQLLSELGARAVGHQPLHHRLELHRCIAHME